MIWLNSDAILFVLLLTLLFAPDLHLYRESYAGHFNSHFSAYIVQKNSEGRNHKINLQGVAMGNAWVDPLHQYAEYGNFMYDRGLLTSSQLAHFNNVSYPLCKASIEAGGRVTAWGTCQAAMLEVLLTSQWNAGRTINVYDVRSPCQVPPLCYDLHSISDFLNQQEVKQALGVSSSLSWASCKYDVTVGLAAYDWIPSFAQDIPIVLQAGVRVLIYSGTEDFIANYYGSANWMKKMQWNGQAGFNASPLNDWRVDGSIAGRVQSYNGFTFLQIFNAGHMAPMDQPVNSLDMLARFLYDKPYA